MAWQLLELRSTGEFCPFTFGSGNAVFLNNSGWIPEIGAEYLNDSNELESSVVLGFSAAPHKVFISVSRSEVTCITVSAYP